MDTKVITVIDYGLGNIYSIEKAFKYLGCNVVVTNNPEVILAAQYIVLPGVGAFGEGIANLQKMGIVNAIKSYAGSGRPFLGICLGMQLVMSWSNELGKNEGLNLIGGKVVSLSDIRGDQMDYKIPHIGWNTLRALNEGVKKMGRYYFGKHNIFGFCIFCSFLCCNPG